MGGNVFFKLIKKPDIFFFALNVYFNARRKCKIRLTVLKGTAYIKITMMCYYSVIKSLPRHIICKAIFCSSEI